MQYRLPDALVRFCSHPLDAGAHSLDSHCSNRTDKADV